MIRRILVPLDGSERGEQALDFALTLAGSGREPVDAVWLLRVPTMDLGEVFLPSMVERDAQWQEADAAEVASLYLRRVQEKHAHADPPLRTMVREGDPAGVILDLAAEEGIDLIVMAPRGVSGFSRWVFGSVTERVLREAPCPVLVAHASPPIEGVIVTLDGSPVAETALPAAVSIARLLERPITLLRVEPGQGATTVAWEEAGGGADFLPPDAAPAAAYLDGAATTVTQSLAPEEVRVRRVLLFGSPPERILEYVEAKGPRLLVMATHGRTGLSRWVYGSVTEKVMRGADRPLLVVRSRIARSGEAPA